MDELRDMVEEYLTDYNDNFVGAPDEDIVDEVLELVQEKLSDIKYASSEEVSSAIEQAVEELYE